jgi:hypothetical protein
MNRRIGRHPERAAAETAVASVISSIETFIDEDAD